MGVKLSHDEVNTEQFNMVTGSIKLSALFCFLIPTHCLPRLSFYPLQSHTFPSHRLTVHSLGLHHSQHMFCFTVSKPFSVSCDLTRIFKLLPHLTSSPSLCLALPAILTPPNHPPASLSLLSPLYTTPPALTLPNLADN